ncbi:MAG TPA: preprotein translocase subunit YajC [Stellaceae bacterium]|nr:preprotein translocase subunit YajC [Stellaceae bacterium]
MLISPAFAQATGGGDSSSMLVQIAPLALIFVVFYFFLIRPQQQKAKQQRSMLDAIRRGDRVVTGGGVIGTVAKVVNNDEILVDIADNVRVRVVRSTVSQVLAKTEPVPAKDKGSSDKDGDGPKDGAASADPKTQEPVPMWRKLLGLR